MKDFVIFVLVIIFASTAQSWPGSKKSSKIKSVNKDWDVLMLTQTWAQTYCTLSNDNNVTCKVPQVVNDWIIHGLWPNYSEGGYPSFCNKSWPFNFTLVQDLESNLLEHWPNLLTKDTETSLWKHEWEKHGTCSASLPALNSQHNYFSKALSLWGTISIAKRLESQGIIPSSDKQYQYDNVMNSLTLILKGTPQLECYVPLENPDVFYIGEIRVCMDKTFKIIDSCSPSKMTRKPKGNAMKSGHREYQPCSAAKPLMIPPIQH